MDQPVDLHTVAPRWWAFCLRGVCHVVIAVASFRLALTAAAGPPGFNLAQAFGALALADGLLVIACATGASFFSWSPDGLASRWAFLTEGAAALALGILALTWPVMPGWVLRSVVCLYAVASGVLMQFSEVTIHNGGRGPDKEACYFVGSLVSIGFGIAFAIWANGVTAGRMFAAFALVQGLCWLLLSAGLKKFSDVFC